MLNIVICDDEKYYRNQIKKLLIKYLNGCQLQYSIDDFSSGEEFYEKGFEILKYDVFFLDINLNDKNGIEIAYKIREIKSDAYIVFVTGFSNYAMEGYKVDAIRYIMKDTLEVSIAECIDTIIKKMKIQINKIEFKFTQVKKQINTGSIVYIESQKHKLLFYISEPCITEYTMYDKLDNIEQGLLEYGFLRIHKSYLINMKYIDKLSNYKAILIFGTELSISKSRYQSVRETFALYKGEI